jgi:hypothetical protein
MMPRTLQLPAHFDDLLAPLNDVDPLDHDRDDAQIESLIYRIAAESSSLHRCDVCRKLIVEVNGVVAYLAERYQLTEGRQLELRDAIMRTGIEIGDTLSPNYCSEHGQITSE